MVKTFEIRDRCTFIPALAVRLNPETEMDQYLFARAGYGRSPCEQREYVYLCCIATNQCQSDPHEWGGRTMPAAHQFIRDYWDALISGQVIDVECILGETAAPKVSERYTT